MTNKPTDLERAEELFAFLQGDVPDKITITNSQTIWYLGNQFWAVPDTIALCDLCEELFDSTNEGSYSEDGPPYHFCGACEHLRPAPDGEEP